MKRMIVFILVCIVIPWSLCAADLRVSVSDFIVNSDNMKYKYMGKGLSEMLAIELRKSPDITLIERDKRTEALDEMEFSLSDLSDSTMQIQDGSGNSTVRIHQTTESRALTRFLPEFLPLRSNAPASCRR